MMHRRGEFIQDTDRQGNETNEDYTYEMLEIPGDAGKKKEKRNSLVLSPSQHSEGILTPEGIVLVRWKEIAF